MSRTTEKQSGVEEIVIDDRRFIGTSPVFLREIEKIPVVAQSDATVLIFGETGTGKELCARAIHALSPRAKNPFVPINCGCLPTQLIENELFGHRAGAFTNASESHAGLIEKADGGTLFLDEIAALPLSAQVKLLRFLQDKEYRPLGSTKTRRADVRIISATSTFMQKAVADGTLRPDLYHRLNMIPITMPPLRERLEDIPVLARHFLAKHFQSSTGPVGKMPDISPEAMRVLLLHPWPGNVRELEHVIQRALVLATTEVIEPSDIVLSDLEPPKGQESLKEGKARVVAKFERDYVAKLLAAHNGNISRAARTAHKNRRAFSQLIRKHRIDAKRFRLSPTGQKKKNSPSPYQ